MIVYKTERTAVAIRWLVLQQIRQITNGSNPSAKIQMAAGSSNESTNQNAKQTPISVFWPRSAGFRPRSLLSPLDSNRDKTGKPTPGTRCPQGQPTGLVPGGAGD